MPVHALMYRSNEQVSTLAYVVHHDFHRKDTVLIEISLSCFNDFNKTGKMLLMPKLGNPIWIDASDPEHGAKFYKNILRGLRYKPEYSLQEIKLTGNWNEFEKRKKHSEHPPRPPSSKEEIE